MDQLLQGDPELARFVEQMEQNQRIQQAASKITNDCFDLCVSNPAVSKLDHKTESCLVNCTERFLDTSLYITNVLTNKISGQSSSLSSGSYGNNEMIMDDKYSFGSNNSTEETKPKSGFKLW